MDKGKNVGTRPGGAERPQESGAAAPGRGGRMSRQRKTAAVLRLLRGEDLDLVSRSLGVTAATLAGWRDAFLAAGEAVLTNRIRPTARKSSAARSARCWTSPRRRRTAGVIRGPQQGGGGHE